MEEVRREGRERRRKEKRKESQDERKRRGMKEWNEERMENEEEMEKVRRGRIWSKRGGVEGGGETQEERRR